MVIRYLGAGAASNSSSNGAGWANCTGAGLGLGAGAKDLAGAAGRAGGPKSNVWVPNGDGEAPKVI